MERYTAPSGALIHVSAEERAGRRALKRRGPKAREHRLWSFLARELEYDAVYDLGANYGQVSLATRYPPCVPVTLVEANPELVPYLQRTIRTHPNHECIRLHSVALGDHEGPATLWVRHDAIGKSSLIRSQGEATQVRITTLDELVALRDDQHRMIIKLDVEGSELAVLAGAASTLASVDDYAIMIELHPGYMRQAAGSRGAYLEALCSYGSLLEEGSNGRIRTFDFAKFIHKDSLTDVVIVSGSTYLEVIRRFNQGATTADAQPVGKLRRLEDRLKRPFRAASLG